MNTHRLDECGDTLNCNYKKRRDLKKKRKKEVKSEYPTMRDR